MQRVGAKTSTFNPLEASALPFADEMPDDLLAEIAAIDLQLLQQWAVEALDHHRPAVARTSGSPARKRLRIRSVQSGTNSIPFAAKRLPPGRPALQFRRRRRRRRTQSADQPFHLTVSQAVARGAVSHEKVPLDALTSFACQRNLPRAGCGHPG